MTVIPHKKHHNSCAMAVAIKNSLEQLVSTWPIKLKRIKSIVQKLTQSIPELLQVPVNHT